MDTSRVSPQTTPSDADVAELTSEIERLRALQEDNSAFARLVQREFRKPLNALTAVLRQLGEAPLEEAHAGMVRSAIGWARMLNRVTSELLELTVIENGGLEAEAVEFDLRVAMDDFVPGVLAQGQARSFSVEIDPRCPARLKGHPASIRRIMNAFARRVAASHPDANLRLGVKRLRETETHVDLAFTIEAQAAAEGRAPTPYAAAEDDFGLAVAKRLAAGLGATAGLLPDRSGYSLSIALAKANVQAAARPAPSLSLKGTRVLFAGVTGPARVAFSVMLRGLGVESDAVDSLEQAHDALRRAKLALRPHHACIVDFSMSPEDAERFARAVAADEDVRTIPIVVMAEVGSSGDAAWAREAGFAAYVVKPVEESVMSNVLTEVLTRRAAAPAEATDTLVTRFTLAEVHRRRLHCLVVDDDRVNLIAMTALLERLGHHVATAETGADAVARASETRFDLAFMDVRLPDSDGDRVAGTIFARQRQNGEALTRMFAMSANALPGDAERCIEAGMTSYHRKPLNLGLVTQLVEKVMNAPGESAAQGPDTPAPGLGHEARESRPANPHADVPAVDFEHLESQSLGIPEVRRSMLNAFLSELDAGMFRLVAGMEGNDAQGTAQAASGLTSLCASIGAHECGKRLAMLERLAASGEMNAARPFVSEALAEADRVRACLAERALD